MIGNNLRIDNVIPEHVESLTSKLIEMGVPIIIKPSSIIVSRVNNLKPVRIKTLGYPGFPTDLQQPITALLTKCKGKSTLIETIYENRFQNVFYLNKMGANIDIKGNSLEINGPSKLVGTQVTATDLRAGACLILAALNAEGTTTINEIEHVLRGYENIVEKLSNVGAKISIKE